MVVVILVFILVCVLVLMKPMMACIQVLNCKYYRHYVNIHATSPWLCKKGDNCLVWMPCNAHVHSISAIFFQAFLGKASFINLGHLPYSARVIKSQVMYLNVQLELALVAIQKCLALLHDYLGSEVH